MPPEDSTLVILSPAFPAEGQDDWLPFQAGFVRTLNKVFPALEVIILSFHFPVLPEQEYTWNGNTVIAFNGAMKGGFESLRLWRKVWAELSRIRKKRKVIGLFSFFCSESAFIGHYFARRHQLRHHIWILGQDARKTNNQVRRIRPAAEELVAISDFLVDEFRDSHGIRPEHMIPIGILTEDYPPAPVNRTIDLIGVGSLFPLKQYNLFIDAVAIIKKSLPDIKAMIIGEGAERERLQQQIQSLRLEDNIVLAGAKNHKEVLRLMQQSRILLHPSSYEGFSMVCKEALYAGAHVISFCRPMHEAIPHFFVVEDVPEMARRAMSLLSDKDTDHSPVLYYSMEDTAAAIMNLFGYPGGAPSR